MQNVWRTQSLFLRSLEVAGRDDCNFSYSRHITLISFKIIPFVSLWKIAHSSSVLAKVEQNTRTRMCRKPRCFLLHSGCLLLHFLNCYLGLFIAPKWYFLASWRIWRPLMVSHVIRHCLVSDACVLPLQAEGSLQNISFIILRVPFAR